MTLTDAHVQQFRQHGYTMVDSFFTPEEVKAMKLELDRLREVGKLRNVRTADDGSTHTTYRVNLQLCPMSPHSDLYKALPFAPKIKQTVTKLLGPDVILHLDQTFVKPGLRGAGTNWHQDNAYFGIEDPLQGTAMWIAVDDATIANGTMRIMPDMFNTPLEHTRDPESDHHIRCYIENERESVPFEIKAGGVGFFCYGTPHCTMANNTVEDRAGVAYHFLTYEASRSGKSAGGFADDDRDYRPYLTGPKATDGRREYGESWDGRWEQLVQEITSGEPVGAGA